MELLELECMACEAKLTGTTEEELLATVQEHIQKHGHARPLTIEHIRSRLRRSTSPDRHDSG
jgi:predicted small metal-binding protein